MDTPQRFMVIRVWYVDAHSPIDAIGEARPERHAHVQAHEYQPPHFYDANGVGCFLIAVPDGSPNGNVDADDDGEPFDPSSDTL